MTPRNKCHIAETSVGSSLVLIALTALLVLCSSSSSSAQVPPLRLGFVSDPGPLAECPEDRSGHLPLTPYAVCHTVTVHGCPTSNQGLFILPDINATIAVSTPQPWNGGTVFLHAGSSGEDYFIEGNGTTYAGDYYYAGFQVVQVAWATGTSWRDNTNQPPEKSMKYEACRPATLLKYVYDTFHGSGAMCAQGHSTGATALAFALAWYNAKSYLNNVVLTSGPAQADIQAGCQYPIPQQFQNPITVCPPDKCIDGTPGSWTDFTTYLNVGPSSAAESVARFTNNPPQNCNDWSQSHTPTGANTDAAWHEMSVVSANADYSYPNTSVYAFLCGPPTEGNPQNNSAAQAWLYLQNLTGAGQTLSHGFYRVDHCAGDEKIWYGGDYPNGMTQESAFFTSKNKMISACVKP